MPSITPNHKKPDACPECGSQQVEGDSFTAYQEHGVAGCYQEMNCLNCECAWHDHYVLDRQLIQHNGSTASQTGDHS